jgi:lysophospholipase L1-like esterase
MVFGDSNAYRPGNGRNCWPVMLQRISGNRLQVINESVDGRTTQYDTGECNGLGIIENKLSNARPLNYLLVALGTNDVKVQYGPPDAPAVVEGLDKIIRTVYKVDASIIPILVTPPPLGHVTTGDLAGAMNRIPSLVAAYRCYATTKNISLIDLYANVDAEGDLESDCVHLNPIGRKKIADIVWNHLQGVFQYV